MDRREQMRRWLARRDRNGLTLRELSRETGVPVGTLGHWAWKLRQEVRTRKPRSPGPAFVELVPAPGGVSRSLEVVLARGRRVVIDPGFDEDLLVRVVRALERC